MKFKPFVAAVLVAAPVALASAPAAAATFEVVSGSGQRSTTAGNVGGSLGQSFTAVESSLTAIGFQFNSLNPTFTGQSYVLSLIAGETLTGTALTTRSFAVPTAINTRTPVWFDIAIDPTAVTIGQRYTAVLSSADQRNAVVFGPDINLFTGAPVSGDAYTGGRALFTTLPSTFTPCTNTAASICDFNFRVTGTTAVAAVPEPASWALVIGGFGLIGGTLRRRRTACAFA